MIFFLQAFLDHQYFKTLILIFFDEMCFSCLSTVRSKTFAQNAHQSLREAYLKIIKFLTQTEKMFWQISYVNKNDVYEEI